MSENNTNVPKIRFPGFTDAWKQRKLGELVSIKSGWSPVNFVKSDDPNSSLFIKVDDLNYSSREQVESNMKVQEHPRFIKMKKGSTIFPKRGAAIMTNKVRILASTGYMDTNMMALEPESIDGEFLYTFIERTGLYKIADTSTIPQINNKHIEPYVVYLPRRNEQERIGEFFKHLDHLINLHQRKLNHLQDEKKSLLQKMFTENGADVPEIRFPGFTDAWKQRELKDVVDVNSGRDYKHLSDGDIPVYGTGGYMLSVNDALSYVEDAIGIGRKGTIDKPCLLRAPFWTVDTLFYAVPREKNDLDFVHSVFQRVNWKQKDESTGVPSLSKTTINAVHVAVPEYDEQVRIGRLFSQLDNLITLHQRKINHLQNQKKSLLQQMFI